MHITIGELVDDILPYANKIETCFIHERPLLKAFISGATGTTKAFIYIMQIRDHKYVLCDNDDVLNGERYFITFNQDIPFIKEKEMADRWFPSEGIEEKEYGNTKVKYVSYDKFWMYFHERLAYYGIIKITQDELRRDIADMGFTSEKIKRVFRESFAENGCKGNTVGDLVDVVSHQHKNFKLPSLRPRELTCIIGKFSDVGLDLTIERNNIIRAELIKAK